MVYNNTVMKGDIIRLKKWPFEVLEICNNSVTGRLLNIGFGEFNEAWTKVQPYGLTDELMACLGFTRVTGYRNTHLWEKISEGMKVTYDTVDHGLSMVGTGTQKRGFCFIYIYTLHELMHQFRDYGVETCKFYKQILDYNPPIFEDIK